MTASATFTINGSATTEPIAAAPGSTVNLALASTTGVDVIQWSVVGNHDPSASNPTITPAGSPSGATATFALPAGQGQAYLIKCLVNPGREDEDSKTAIAGVLNASGIVPYVIGEQLERHATYGWTVPQNQTLANGQMAYTTSSDATTFSLFSWTPPTNSQTQVDVQINGKRNSDGAAVFYWLIATFKTISGTVTQVDTTAGLVTSEDAAVAAASADVNTAGSTIRVRVTGIAATAMSWSGVLRKFETSW